jgi:hypothetical protein
MRSQYGLNKVDFLIVVILFGVLASVFLYRIEHIQAEAEKTEVALTMRNLRLGMQLAVGELLIAGKDDQIRQLLDRNPFRFLDQPPSGYAGEATNPPTPGGWVFDANRKEIAYRPRLPEAFDGRDVLRWRYIATADRADRMTGLRLVEAE